MARGLCPKCERRVTIRARGMCSGCLSRVYRATGRRTEPGAVATWPPVPATEVEPAALAWAAGFIDGEGSLSLAKERDPRKGPTYFHYRPMLQVVNTNGD